MESLIALSILGIMVTGVVSGFIQSHRTAEWSSTSLAAQSFAMQAMEQARAAKWDPFAKVPVDELVATNFPGTTNVLDIPISGTNVTYATNRIWIRTASTTPPLKEIYVECTWRGGHNGRTYTNSVLTYRAPDQ